jgi:glycosyltransferase involved in cell wall biosynthesis
MNVSIVMPAHNESASIAGLIKEIKNHVPDAEIIVVNDASTDDTEAVAKNCGVRVVTHPYNIGNGAAVKTGLRAASGDVIVLMDADGQHNPADIPNLLKEISSYDMVVGARDPSTHATVFRRIANSFYNILASYVTKFKIRDLTSGFRVMKKATVLSYLCLLPNTFSYPTTLTLAYIRSGRSVCYVPIRARKRKGQSKIRIVHDGFLFLVIIIKIATLFSPLLVFLPVSVFFFLLGLINYTYTYLIQHRFTNMSALCIISSVVIFMMGLISEQITQLRYDRIENGG